MYNSKQEELNKRQSEFYDLKKKGAFTKIWYALRNGLLQDTRKRIGLEKDIYNLHRSWFGDLSKKKVLDLGCFEGNSLSYTLASDSKEYIGLDLSPKGIDYLNRRFKEIPNAKGIVGDFLSSDFQDKEFDLIYAYGVLHHFKDTDEIICKLKEKLASGGEIISNDPLQTSLPVNLLRVLYRPFQSDKDWEWPFTKKTFYKYEMAFEIIDRRAVLGKSKWFFLLNLLPFSTEHKLKIGIRWHREDWEKSRRNDATMFKCMHLTMRMRKKD